MLDVGSWAAAGDSREDQVVDDVDQQANLRESAIGGMLPAFSAFGAASNEVVADVIRLEATAVDGGTESGTRTDSGTSCLSQRGIEQRIGEAALEQAVHCFLQRGEMRYVVKVNDLSQVLTVGEHGDDTAVIGLEEPLEHEAGEELMLGTLLGAKAVCVGR